MNITNEMYETMMHMIGYGIYTDKFVDAIDCCDQDSLVELAKECNNRWGNCVDIQALEKQLKDITRRNKNAQITQTKKENG